MLLRNWLVWRKLAVPSMIGNIAERRGDAASAFAAFETMNAAAIAEAPPRHGPTYRESVEADLVRWSPDWAARWAPPLASDPARRDPVFLVGFPRSGTTLLDTMLNVPLEKALESVALPQPVTDALLHGTGVFAPFLELTKACESGDDATFARMADELHLSNRQVNWAHLQALTWAESLNED